MLKMITSRINALMKISWSADFKTRKNVANAIVMSRLVYIIQVYGNSSDYLLKFLQILQNKAARIVTKLGWGTNTSFLLNQIGWLSVKQLIAYHSLLLMYKIRKNDKPVSLKLRVKENFAYQTRQAANNNLVRNEAVRTDKLQNSFLYNTTALWNKLPPHLKNEEKLLKFKKLLKTWVKLNIMT